MPATKNSSQEKTSKVADTICHICEKPVPRTLNYGLIGCTLGGKWSCMNCFISVYNSVCKENNNLREKARMWDTMYSKVSETWPGLREHGGVLNPLLNRIKGLETRLKELHKENKVLKLELDDVKKDLIDLDLEDDIVAIQKETVNAD